MKNIALFSVCLFFISQTAIGQSRVSIDEYRGTQEMIARGILEGNAIQTNFRNHGEHSRWGDLPWGIWPNLTCDRFDPTCTGGGGRHIDGVGFIVAAKVVGEQAKWSYYYGEGARDTTLNPVIINYKAAGIRVSPYSSNIWGWLPLNGFHNISRVDPITFSASPVPATSDDNTSWPNSWPDRLSETTDAGWPGSWNGFRGKGLATGNQETFYVMDDFSDHEYSFGQEVEGPHSTFGVYQPSPSDSSMGGLGIQTEVRTFQFNDGIGKDMLFTHYRMTNVSEKDLEEVWTSILLESGLGVEEDDDNAQLFPEHNMIMLWDSDGVGEPTQVGSDTYDLGYVGFMLLEHSLDETNGIDDDNDGIIDESKFNGPGELIEGQTAIEAYLNANYNRDRFDNVFIPLDEFPAYQFGSWWTGDEDLDWVPFEDWNENGIYEPDLGEELIDDVGRDGIGPGNENYMGPDEGEADGIPTQGEPNFGELDMLEAENGDLTVYDLNTRPYYESGNNLRDDTWMFDRIFNSQISNPDFVMPGTIVSDEPMVIMGVGPFELPVNSSSYFITALFFAEDSTELFKKREQILAIYESDYGQSIFLTNSEEDGSQVVPTEISLSQNYPNPFNPTTNIEFSLNTTASVNLAVYDVMGREVSRLISGQNYSAGSHSINFDASGLSSGIYFYQLKIGRFIQTKKMMLIK
ncbi:MAG: T9SS C-terminal target domain-containing protein [Balneola sp.]|nr:MAG: T9SS C-terminal target domain-containing protein [Balneola sp.]